MSSKCVCVCISGRTCFHRNGLDFCHEHQTNTHAHTIPNILCCVYVCESSDYGSVLRQQIIAKNPSVQIIVYGTVAALLCVCVCGNFPRADALKLVSTFVLCANECQPPTASIVSSSELQSMRI